MSLLRRGLAKLLMGIGIVLIAAAAKLDDTVVYAVMEKIGLNGEK